MKKLLAAFLAVLMMLSVSAWAADDLLIMPSPTQTQTEVEKSEERALLESLHKGIIPLTPETSYSDVISYMEIIDESENKFNTAKFSTLIDMIPYYYYGNITPEELFDRFVNTADEIDINNMEKTYKTLFSLLDKFSYYLTAEEATAFFSPTASKGAGIMMAWRDAYENEPNGIYIEEVAKGSPAETAGILAGDRIVEFNGYDLKGLGFEALSTYLSLVDPDAKTLDITLERYTDGSVTETEYALERTQNIFSEYSLSLYPEKNLVYLDINSFMYEHTAYDIAADIDVVWSQGYKNIIIDLQNNSGGDVYIASYILSKFTSEVEPLFFMGREGKTNTLPFISTGNGYDFDSVNILVNGSTASSSEIFANTLDRIADAKIIGTKTFGKGVAQSVVPFLDGTACGITTFVAYDPSGKTYNEKGLTPDAISTGRIEKNTLPSDTPVFTALNYYKAAEGADNSTVRGLEIRLEALGFLSPEEVDTKWSEATTRAIKALQTYLGYEATGALNKDTYYAIMSMISLYKESYSYTFTPFDYAYRLIPFAGL